MSFKSKLYTLIKKVVISNVTGFYFYGQYVTSLQIIDVYAQNAAIGIGGFKK